MRIFLMNAADSDYWIIIKTELANYTNFKLNPIPAEVLENQDTLGGGQFDPPL